mgnify:FL=1
MPEFIEFYKNDKFQFCIRTDDIKILSLQRNLIIEEESIRVSEEMRKANYIDSINNYSKKWKCKKGAY